MTLTEINKHRQVMKQTVISKPYAHEKDIVDEGLRLQHLGQNPEFLLDYTFKLVGKDLN